MKRTLAISMVSILILAAALLSARPLASTSVQRINTPPVLVHVIRPSPDGTLLAAGIDRLIPGKKIASGLLILRPDGTVLTERYAFPPHGDAWQVSAIAWHPQGHLFIAVDVSTPADRERNPSPDRTALFELDPAHLDQPPHQVIADLAPITDMDWSPDGQWLLMGQAWGPPLPNMERWTRPDVLSVYNPRTGQVSKWQEHDTALTAPRWHPDGQDVLYSATFYVGSEQINDQTLVMQAWRDGATERFSLEPACGITEPAWSPDGQWIVYVVICQNLNGQRVHTLVVAPHDNPLAGTRICQEQALNHPWWLTPDTVVATTVGFSSNEIVRCRIPIPPPTPTP